MRIRGSAALAALLVMMAAPLVAQERPVPPPPPAPPAPPAPPRAPMDVEAALRMREELKLSDSQVAQLEALRKERVTQRQNEAREMIDLESRLAAGLIERDEMRKQMEARRTALRDNFEKRRERIANILTDEQEAQLARRGMGARRMDVRRTGRPGMAPRPDRAPRRPPIPGRYYWF